MLMQNVGEQTRSIMVFSEVAYIAIGLVYGNEAKSSWSYCSTYSVLEAPVSVTNQNVSKFIPLLRTAGEARVLRSLIRWFNI